jgi:hypothetical protein
MITILDPQGYDNSPTTYPAGRRPAPQASQEWLLWRPILVTKSQLDQLEQRGYLDHGRRGERLDECDAIEIFPADALPKSR